jgi:hypothetical protein
MKSGEATISHKTELVERQKSLRVFEWLDWCKQKKAFSPWARIQFYHQNDVNIIIRIIEDA